MVQVVMTTARGEQHGLIKTLPNSVREDEGLKNMSPENKAKCEKMRKDDNRMIKGRYINRTGKHERLTRPYMRHAGDPIRYYHLIPDHEYELPKGFVDEINQHRMPVRSGKCDANGDNPIGNDTTEIIHEIVPCSF
jgi:hypothetical protein